MNEPVSTDHRTRVAAERRARMRAQLLDAGFALVVEKGPEGFSIDDVVARAGVARGSFYKYFASTGELVRALALDLSEELIATVNAAVRVIADPAERAAIGMRAVLGLARHYPMLGAFIVRAGWPVSEPGHAFFRLVGPNVDAGLSSGRFAVGHRSVALNLVGGLSVGAMHSLLTETLPEDFPDLVAEALLCGLGLLPDAAAALARLPFVLPVPPSEGRLARMMAPPPDAEK